MLFQGEGDLTFDEPRKLGSEVEAFSGRLAWMTGVLAAGGAEYSTWIETFGVRKRPEILAEIQRIGIEQLGLSPLNFTKSGLVYIDSVREWNERIDEELGDMRHAVWPWTVKANKQLYANPRSLWEFLSGYFDIKGWVTDPVKVHGQNRLRLSDYTEAGCYALGGMLSELGFHGHVIGHKKGGLAGVELYRWEEIKKFAQNTAVLDPTKRDRLAAYVSIVRPSEAKEGVQLQEQYIAFHEMVLRVREETGLGPYRLVRHPELEELVNELGVSVGLISWWIYHGGDPRRNTAFVSGPRPITIDYDEEFVRLSPPELRRVVPANESAWILGALSGGGTTDVNGGIGIDNKSRELVEEFRRMCEFQFSLPCFVHPRKAGYKMRMYDSYLVSQLGDLRVEKWAATVRAKHSWVFTSPDYVRAFVSGVFDVTHVVIDEATQEIRLRQTTQECATELAIMISSLGIKGLKILDKTTSKGGTVHIVVISGQENMGEFARLVYSSDPKKEQGLQRYRAT